MAPNSISSIFPSAMPWPRPALFRAAGLMISSAALIAATPALAQEVSQQEMADLIRAQAAEIASLKSRIEKLEQQNVSTAAELAAEPAPAPITSAPTTMAPASPAPQVAASAPSSPSGLRADWSEGAPEFSSADGKFTFKPRGRILADVSSTFGSDFDGRNITTTGMRGLRMGFEGTVGPRFFYQMELEFGEGVTEVKTAFLGWKNRFNDHLAYDVRVGQLFNDRSFDGSTSSANMAFMERNTVASTIVPQRGFFGMGAMGRLFGDNWHASLSLTGDAINSDQSIGDTRTLTARAHWNPIKQDDKMLHLGLWAFDESLSDPLANLSRNAIIGGRFNGALRVSTGPLIGATSTTGYGAEVGGYLGSLWVMGEAGRRIGRLDQNRPNFTNDAWSLSAGYFLTGERPPYSSRTGTYTKPKVLSPVFDGGSGAVELTARYEALDFGDAPLGGKGNAATLGANWYLNNFVRLQLNAIFWSAQNRTGPYIGKDDGQTLSTRFAISF